MTTGNYSPVWNSQLTGCLNRRLQRSDVFNRTPSVIT